jgi:hypothetical protein
VENKGYEKSDGTAQTQIVFLLKKLYMIFSDSTTCLRPKLYCKILSKVSESYAVITILKIKSNRNIDKSGAGKKVSKGGVHFLNISDDLANRKLLPIHLMITS